MERGPGVYGDQRLNFDSKRMDFVSAITGVIFDHAWDPISRHFGYLISYKRNINKLERKFDELDALRKDVKREVDAARLERLEDVKDVVQTWLMTVDIMEKEVKGIKAKASLISNKHFLHIGFHYKLGKEAANHIKTTDALLEDRNKFGSVSYKRAPPSTTNSLLYNEGFVIFDSRKSHVKKILEALKNKAVHSIGLCGMGGVGKTMLVKDVAKQAKDQRLFGEVVMVTVSQNIDLKRIQNVMAEILGLHLLGESEEVRASTLAERFAKNKILVILDDLWETLDLSKVGIQLSQMAATCKVVITTRNRDVCEGMSCQEIVELETLSNEESWRLFTSRAGDAVESPTMRELAHNIVKECAGLPMALVVLGAALKSKRPEIWKIVLKLLKKSMEVDLSEKVFQSIKLSFDFLKSETAKSCFLHCCLYPEDYDISKEELMHLMVGGHILIDDETLNDAQGMVDLLLDQLKTSCLLLQSSSESCVRMHDVVRDAAIQIGAKADHAFYVKVGQGLEEWPKTVESEIRRLSLMNNDIKDLPPDPMQYVKLEMLFLRGNGRLSSIPEMFFQHMGCLMVLDLSSTGIELLPKSVSCLTNLRVLNLRRCHSLKDISHINGLKKLEILILGGCPVSIFPKGVEWVKNVRYVNLIPPDTHLNVWSDFIYQIRSLCLDDYFSKEFPRFHKLEQLFMGRFEGSFRELIISLRHLTHIFIKAVVDLDDSLSHELVSPGSWPNQLLYFSITFLALPRWWSLCPLRNRCLRLIGPKPLAVWVKRLLKKTIRLKLANFEETELSSIIDCLLLSSLECLEIFNWPNLSKMVGDELLLPTLENLDITNCQEMSEIISSPASLQALGFFQGLRDLAIYSCPRLTHLFSYKQAISMQHLSRLYIHDCAALGAVVISKENEEEASSSTHVADHESYNSPFPNLRDLILFDLPQLTAFHHPTAPPVEWLHLTSHKIEGCPKLQEPLEERIRSLRSRSARMEKKAGSVKGE